MRVYLLLLICYLLSPVLRAQRDYDYTVVAVRGSVERREIKKPLRSKNRIKKAEALIFEDNQARALVIDRRNATYMMMKGKEKSGYRLLPTKRPQNTRPGPINNIFVLRKYLSPNPFPILDGRLGVTTSPNGLPQNESNFFFIRYFWKGEQIDKKIPRDGQTFFLDIRELYLVDGVQVPADSLERQTIYYYHAEDEFYDTIADFNPVYVSGEKLRDELVALLSELPEGATRKDKMDLIEIHLFNFYGITDLDHLEEWLLQNSFILNDK